MELLRRYAASYGSHKGPEAAVAAPNREGRCGSCQTTAAKRPVPGLQDGTLLGGRGLCQSPNNLSSRQADGRET